MPSEFQRVLTEAVADTTKHGYSDAARLEAWIVRLRLAAERDMTSAAELADGLRRVLGSTYHRLVDQGGIARAQGVPKWTIERVRPQLRAELDRRILASAQLIQRNKAEAVEKTMQRFQGWATSIPPGGSRAVERGEVKKTVRKALAQQPFEERRVLIDQGAKLSATLNQIAAEGTGAIAVEWKSRFRQPGYNYREDHKERDGNVYALRGNWAIEAGLMKPGPAGYYDGVTSVAEEPFCRCSGVWMHNLRDLPEDMLTAKGRDELERVRGLIRAAS